MDDSHMVQPSSTTLQGAKRQALPQAYSTCLRPLWVAIKQNKTSTRRPAIWLGGRGHGCQAPGPEFYVVDAKGGRRILTAERCPLTSMGVLEIASLPVEQTNK